MLEIETHEKNTLWLRTELAAGETAKGEQFSISLNIDNSCLIFMFPEATYTVCLHALMDTVMGFRQEQQGEDNDQKRIDSVDRSSDPDT
jgi:hypothetical protein